MSDGSHQTDWLKVTIERMEADLKEVKSNVQVLLLHKAETHGKVIVVSSIMSVLMTLLVGWLVKS